MTKGQGYFEEADTRTGKAPRHQAAKKPCVDISNSEIKPVFTNPVTFKVLMSNLPDAHIVGGAVRDKFMGKTPHDVDVVTSALPTEVLKMFKSYDVGGQKYGTVLVLVSDELKEIEVTTMRSESGGRHPEVRFSKSIIEDLSRRDFTFNAMALDKKGCLIDPFNGLQAIQDEMIISVYDPVKMLDINEGDPLRAVRAARFAHLFSYKIESTLEEAIMGADLSKLSGERIYMEIEKMFKSNPSGAIYVLNHYDILEKILPEIKNMQKCEHNPIHHPDGNCFEHTLYVLEYLKNEDMIIKMCGMLHDVGKPEVHEEGCLSYHGHDKAGIDIGKAVMKRFGRPKSEIDTVAFVIKNHMKMHKLEEMKASKRRKLYDSPYFGILLKVVQADGSMRGFSPQLIEDFVNQDVITRTTQVKPLIDGNIIMSYGIAPGPMIKEIQNDIVEQQIEGNITTEKEALQYFVSKYKKPGCDIKF